MAQGAVEEPTAEDCRFLRVFEQNDAGQWQRKNKLLPNLPTISYSDVDPEAFRTWVESKKAENELQDQKWVDAIEAYVDAIEEPWHAFLDQAEQLSDENFKMGMQNSEEVISYIADNTFVDGKSLNEIFPEIEEFMAEYRDSKGEVESEVDEYFNFDWLRMTPRTLAKRSGVDHPNQAMVAEGEDSDDDEDSSHRAGEKLEKVCDKIESAVVSYGYDPEVAKAWLQDKSKSWEELQDS